MSSSANPIVVRHNVEERRFETEIGGEVCVAEYERRGTELVMTHTYVAPALRGQGIAETLVRAALEYARDERLRVVPACSYVAAFIKRHAEFQPLVMA